jgi:hypothetical protein
MAYAINIEQFFQQVRAFSPQLIEIYEGVIVEPKSFNIPAMRISNSTGNMEDQLKLFQQMQPFGTYTAFMRRASQNRRNQGQRTVFELAPDPSEVLSSSVNGSNRSMQMYQGQFGKSVQDQIAEALERERHAWKMEQEREALRREREAFEESRREAMNGSTQLVNVLHEVAIRIFPQLAVVAPPASTINSSQPKTQDMAELTEQQQAQVETAANDLYEAFGHDNFLKAAAYLKANPNKVALLTSFLQ